MGIEKYLLFDDGSSFMWGIRNESYHSIELHWFYSDLKGRPPVCFLTVVLVLLGCFLRKPGSRYKHV